MRQRRTATAPAATTHRASGPLHGYRAAAANPDFWRSSCGITIAVRIDEARRLAGLPPIGDGADVSKVAGSYEATMPALAADLRALTEQVRQDTSEAYQRSFTIPDPTHEDIVIWARQFFDQDKARCESLVQAQLARQSAPQAATAPGVAVPQDITTPDPAASDDPGPVIQPPADAVECDVAGLLVGPKTSCEFAHAVVDAWVAQGGGNVDLKVASPVTKRTYRVHCVQSPANLSSQLTTCRTDTGATVYLY